MTRLIGMDEAGYGPNLGPLVVGLTDWQCDEPTTDSDLWDALSDSVTRSAGATDGRLHMGDSKDVYSPSRGIRNLETAVLAALHVTGVRPQTFSELHQQLLGQRPESEPWFDGPDVRLPLAANPREVDAAAEQLRSNLADRGIRLNSIRCDIVLTRRFNSLVRDFDNKASALSRTSMRLLGSVWDPDTTEPTFIVADKHGGRNRYDELLEDIIEDRMIFRIEEGRERSVYRLKASQIVFRTRAEAHLPVALASMVAKYAREVSMELFNQFWCERVPGLQPTHGYPSDASRFRNAIAAAASRLGLQEDEYWRSR